MAASGRTASLNCTGSTHCVSVPSINFPLYTRGAPAALGGGAPPAAVPGGSSATSNGRGSAMRAGEFELNEMVVLLFLKIGLIVIKRAASEPGGGGVLIGTGG